jgi:hypothetical protein
MPNPAALHQNDRMMPVLAKRCRRQAEHMTRLHLVEQGLKERHSSTTECPKCGEALVERTARSGRNVGGKFLGCSAFPKCRYTRTQ